MDESGAVVDDVVALLERAARAHARSGRGPLARSLRMQARRLRAAFPVPGPAALHGARG